MLTIVCKGSEQSLDFRLTIMVEDQLVKVPSRRFLPNILVNHFLPKPVQGDGIGQRFAAALYGEGYRGIPYAEPLPIDRAHWDTPVLRIHPC